MTLFECTLLITNVLMLIPLIFFIRGYKKLEKKNKELWWDILKFSEDTLMQIDKLEVALEDCKKKQVIKSKAPKNEKKTISK